MNVDLDKSERKLILNFIESETRKLEMLDFTERESYDQYPLELARLKEKVRGKDVIEVELIEVEG